MPACTTHMTGCGHLHARWKMSSMLSKQEPTHALRKPLLVRRRAAPQHVIGSNRAVAEGPPRSDLQRRQALYALVDASFRTGYMSTLQAPLAGRDSLLVPTFKLPLS